MDQNHLPPGLPSRNLEGKEERGLGGNRAVTLTTVSTSYHSALATTASCLTSLFLSSSG